MRVWEDRCTHTLSAQPSSVLMRLYEGRVVAAHLVDHGIGKAAVVVDAVKKYDSAVLPAPQDADRVAWKGTWGVGGGTCS